MNNVILPGTLHIHASIMTFENAMNFYFRKTGYASSKNVLS